jgi:hypothetical protein
MDESKVDELRRILRDLAWLVGQQQEIILSQTAVIGAVRMTLEGNPDLAKKYAANLQSLKDAAHKRQNLDQAAVNMASDLLRRMQQW